MLLEVLLDFSDHFNGVKSFHLALHAEGFTETHEDFRFVGVQESGVDADDFQNLIWVALFLDQGSLYLGH